jgi:hypothetical protein
LVLSLKIQGTVGAAAADTTVAAGQAYQAAVGLPGTGASFRISANALAGRTSVTAGAEERIEAEARIALAVGDATIVLTTEAGLAGPLGLDAHAVVVAKPRLNFSPVAA